MPTKNNKRTIRKTEIIIDEGDVVVFYHKDATHNKFAINLEPYVINKNKSTFNCVLTTSQKIQDIYPCDYLLPEGIFPKPTKVICDQPMPIYKGSVLKKFSKKITKDDLQEIRKRTAASLGLSNYDNTTTSGSSADF